MEKRNCACGCGKETRIVSHTHNKVGRIKGEPSKFISGHNLRCKDVREKARLVFEKTVKGKKTGIFKKCVCCNDEYYIYPSEERGRGRIRKYCSTNCRHIHEKELYKQGKIKIWNKGIPHTEEHKAKLKETRKRQVTPIKDTKIEVKIQNYLKQLGVDFFTHQYINIEHGYQCDIFIPAMELIIECDGDYWHKYPIGRDIDDIRTKELIEKGFKVLRLWEREINDMDIHKFEKKLESRRFL